MIARRARVGEFPRPGGRRRALEAAGESRTAATGDAAAKEQLLTASVQCASGVGTCSNTRAGVGGDVAVDLAAAMEDAVDEDLRSGGGTVGLGGQVARGGRVAARNGSPRGSGEGAATGRPGPYGRGADREPRTVGEELRPRLDALRELIALSRTRLDAETLEDAGRVLEAANERYRLSGEYTVVAIAGATGSGKSSLFNALAGASRSQVGARRPTTCQPVACVWSDGRPGAEGLLDRLGVPAHRRHTPADEAPELRGLILLDLPDHDSAATENRTQVDRMLELVDAVIWVVDPEKYADAVLHERYLRPLAGYAEVTFVVLNQVDRLPGDATDQVVDDLRRLLDEDGLALGEHGEPGAVVLALSAATGEGVVELRETLGQFVAERGAASRRLMADVDAAAERLRSVYVAERRIGLTERAREEFDDRLAEAVGAVATGRAAERDWLRHAYRAYGSPWSRLNGWRRGRRAEEGHTGSGLTGAGPAGSGPPGAARTGAAGIGARVGNPHAGPAHAGPGAVGRQGQYGQTSAATGVPGSGGGEGALDVRAAARPVVEQAVRAVAGDAARGLPAPWAQAVREAASRGAAGLPGALDKVAADAEESLRGGPVVKPRWWTVAAALQGLLFALQVVGVLWLLGAIVGLTDTTAWLPALLPAAIGSVGGPVLAWICRIAARGPARRYGQEAERRLRSAAAGCGRARVLEPVAAELLRYREVREQYAVASGA
ncbi:GTPase [Streptomyces sp. NPDC017993]|uniref:GTPase n=1 Tax=Streptomyces sp. NPDC017993 TaxID=3365027 RepID=UPI0037981758